MARALSPALLRPSPESTASIFPMELTLRIHGLYIVPKNEKRGTIYMRRPHRKGKRLGVRVCECQCECVMVTVFLWYFSEMPMVEPLRCA